MTALPRNITLTPSGTYHLRVTRNGRQHSSCHATVEAAVELRDTFARAKATPRGPDELDREREHLRQLRALNLTRLPTGVGRSAYGYTVQFMRGEGKIYLGHYSGPDGLAEACRVAEEFQISNPTKR